MIDFGTPPRRCCRLPPPEATGRGGDASPNRRGLHPFRLGRLRVTGPCFRCRRVMSVLSDSIPLPQSVSPSLDAHPLMCDRFTMALVQVQKAWCARGG